MSAHLEKDSLERDFLEEKDFYKLRPILAVLVCCKYFSVFLVLCFSCLCTAKVKWYFLSKDHRK